MEAFLRVLLRRLLLGSRAVPLVLCEGCAEHQDVEEEARHHDGTTQMHVAVELYNL